MERLSLDGAACGTGNGAGGEVQLAFLAEDVGPYGQAGHPLAKQRIWNLAKAIRPVTLGMFI